MTFEELQASPHLGRHLGRMQIAVLMVQKGYAKDVDDALDHWIGNSSPYYLNPSEYVTYIGMKDCVKKISEAHGLPILAHPYHYGYTEAQIEAFVADFRSLTRSIHRPRWNIFVNLQRNIGFFQVLPVMRIREPMPL